MPRVKPSSHGGFEGPLSAHIKQRLAEDGTIRRELLIHELMQLVPPAQALRHAEKRNNKTRESHLRKGITGGQTTLRRTNDSQIDSGRREIARRAIRTSTLYGWATVENGQVFATEKLRARTIE